jgi:hypothetical protein
MTTELLVQILLGLIGILLTIVGAAVAYILYGMKEQMSSTREDITSLAQSAASMVATLGWHQKWLERHDDEIKSLREHN